MSRTKHKIITYDDLTIMPKLGNCIYVLTCGVWDCLHVGHVQHLEFCETQGQFTFVCVGADETVRMLKGEDRPIHSERHRARMVAALQCVSGVVISEEHGRMNFVRLMEILKPDILVVAGDDPARDAKFALCERMGVRMVVDDTRPVNGPSTTGIVRQIMQGANT